MRWSPLHLKHSILFGVCGFDLSADGDRDLCDSFAPDSGNLLRVSVLYGACDGD